MPKRATRFNKNQTTKKKKKVIDLPASFPESSVSTQPLSIENIKKLKLKSKHKPQLQHSIHQREQHQTFVHRQNDASISPHQRIQELLKKNKKRKKRNNQKPQKSKLLTSNHYKTKKNANTNHNELTTSRLDGAQFRWMNEMLYNSTGYNAMETAQSHEDTFIEYHKTYNDIVQHQWPQSPLQKVIRSITKKIAVLSKRNPAKQTYIVADFGCGDAKIAQYFDQTYNNNKNNTRKVEVHSFDLVALNKYVVACDVSDVPLESESVDMVIFCLSLMGTNFHEYLIEAHRILKTNGLLKIAEVRSRFYGINKFEKFLNRCGFEVVAKDLDNTHFSLFHCAKSNERMCQTFPKLFDAKTVLKPCAYKKR